MKKFMALAFALFFAVANAAETYEASEKITQEILAGEGKFTQTVNAGDEIASIKIWYHGMDENKHQSGNISEIGLTEKWTGSVCEISGKIDRDLITQTVKAYILVQDDEGKFAKTEFIFNVIEKEFLFALDESFGEMNQKVKAGETIQPIVINFEKVKEIKKGALPSGLEYIIDDDDHTITITGTVDATVESGDYEYKVTAVDKNSKEYTLSGTFTVEGLSNVTKIWVVENETQKVTAGTAFKPIKLKFANVAVTDKLTNFKFEQNFASLGIEALDNEMLVSGSVSEKTKDGTYTIKIIAMGELNNDTAFATVEVVHNPVVTSVSVYENETQTVTAGDSIEPIVFKFENIVGFEGKGITGFPGSFKAEVDDATKTVIVFGLVRENADGPYTVKLSVKGADNDASAEATINVTPVKLKFELVEGSGNQTVVAGEAITPIVYQYDHMLSVHGSDFPGGLEMKKDDKKKQVTISGIVGSNVAAKEYVFTLEVTDVHSEKTTVTGTINVVRESSSSSVASSSSTESSSSAKSSSSIKQSSSSSKKDKSSSSSVKQSSSSSKKDKSSSSSAKSGKSSSSKKSDKIVTVAMNGVKFGYANNALTVALPTSSMVRVQVFDLMGHLVETFAEPVNGTKSISLAHLNRGNYLVRVESNSMVRTARIAVK